MKSKKIFLILTILLVGIIGYLLYELVLNQTSNDASLDDIVADKRYNITKRNENVSVSFFVKPEFISTSQKNKVFELDQNQIFLDSVEHRKSDIYFSFHTNLKLQKNRGNFIFPGTLQDDRVFSTPSEEIKLITPDKEIIRATQIGFGPSADFSFGIDIKDQNKITQGFTVMFNGFRQYDYYLSK